MAACCNKANDYLIITLPVISAAQFTRRFGRGDWAGASGCEPSV